MNADKSIKRLGAIILTEYIITIVHHVIEGLGFVFDFRIKSLITPFTFGIPLLITLGLLFLYRETRHRFVLVVFSIATVLWWIVGIGLTDGFYNHTLNVLLVFLHTPPEIMKAIYPTYVANTNLSVVTIPCDGVQFSFCSLTPAVILYEGSGILSFVVACLLAFYMYQLLRKNWNAAQSQERQLPRLLIIGVSLAMLPAFGAVPLLGTYMSTGQPRSLFMAVALMAASILAVALSIVWIRRSKLKDTKQKRLASNADNL